MTSITKKLFLFTGLALLGGFGVFTQNIQADSAGLSIIPRSGNVNLFTEISFPVYDTECTSYRIDFGDGVIEHEPSPLKTTGCDNAISVIHLTHVFTQSGNYTVRLQSGRGALSELQTSTESLTVNVGESTNILRISPEVGEAPLNTTVRFAIEGSCTSYDLDFGDGSSHKTFAATNFNNCSGATTKAFQHSYIEGGNYNLILKSGKVDFQALEISDEKSIIVNNSRDALEIIGTKAGKAPFETTFKALLNGKGSCQASSYTLDFGDGETQDLSVPAGTSQDSDFCGRSTQEIPHTYNTRGVFTSKLKRGSQVIQSHIFNIGDADNCPVLNQPSCAFDENLISSGVDRDGCDTGWQCVQKGDVNVLCPTTKRPSCSNSQKPKSLGWVNGCYIGWECVADNGSRNQEHGDRVQCEKPEKPNIIQCRSQGGIFVDKGRDEHGCWKGFQCSILEGDSNYNPPDYSYLRNNRDANVKNLNRVRVRGGRGHSNLGRSFRDKLRDLRNLKSRKKGVNRSLKVKSNLSSSQLKLRRGASLKERLKFLREIRTQKRGTSQKRNLFPTFLKERNKTSRFSFRKKPKLANFRKSKVSTLNKFSQNRKSRGGLKRKERTFNFKKYSSDFKRFSR